MNAEGYAYFKNQILRENKRGQFLRMSNHAIAEEFYEKVRKDFPEVQMYVYDNNQYFILGEKSAKKFQKFIAEMIVNKKKELCSCRNLEAVVLQNNKKSK